MPRAQVAPGPAFPRPTSPTVRYGPFATPSPGVPSAGRRWFPFSSSPRRGLE